MSPGLSPKQSSAPQARYRKSAGPSEISPLLPTKSQDTCESFDGYSKASFLSAVLSLSTTIVGAGIMGLPATMKTTGLIPGIALILLVGLLTNYSIELLLKYSSEGKAISYGGVMADAFGRVGRILLQTCVTINNFGLLVVYLIIIADVLSGTKSSLVHHTGVLEEWAGGPTWWNGRVFVMLCTIVFVIIPLVSFRHVDSLKISSAVSVALAVVFVVVTAIIMITKMVTGHIDMPKLFPHVYDQSSFLSLFAVVPVLVTAFICHFNVHPIINELENTSDAQAVVSTSLGLCTFIYVATSLFAYLLFGDQTMSDVLSNFDNHLGIPCGDLLSGIVRVGYAIHLMLVFPLLHFTLRSNVDGLIFPTAAPLYTDTRRFVLITSCLIILSFVGASFVPNIWDAFQFTGATSAVCLGFIFPGIIVLRDVHDIATRKERCLAWFMVVLAIVASLIAISSDIYTLFNGSKMVTLPSGSIGMPSKVKF